MTEFKLLQRNSVAKSVFIKLEPYLIHLSKSNFSKNIFFMLIIELATCEHSFSW